ncbi:ribonuclease-like [Emys orbicularis]|uniref:ribonuclease-like n=1 Tax=Emys orbicularis TaxID=82168 RepID=UPI0031FCF333
MAMATRGPCPALLLPLILLAACLALARRMPWVSLNNIFKKYHVDFPPTPGPDPSTYCNGMMRDWGIHWKLLHIFIHTPIPAINSICFGDGTPIFGGLRKSMNFFPTTTCRYNPVRFSYSGTAISWKLIIACWNGLPLLYVEKMKGQAWAWRAGRRSSCFL